jgi:hypothetical protein
MCSNLAITRTRPAGAPAPSKDPTARVASLVEAVILLRGMLRTLPALAESVAWVETPLMKAVSRWGRPCIFRRQCADKRASVCRITVHAAASQLPCVTDMRTPTLCHQIRSNLVRPELQELLEAVEAVLEEAAQVGGRVGGGRESVACMHAYNDELQCQDSRGQPKKPHAGNSTH